MHSALSILSDPVRMRVLEILRDREHSAGEIERALGLSQPAASKHLRALREAGLVRVRKDANRRLYALDAAPLAALDAWLAPFRAFWDDRLDSLQRHLDQES
jgi:DNA-binding transcriptional ArsR family regulator